MLERISEYRAALLPLLLEADPRPERLRRLLSGGELWAWREEGRAVGAILYEEQDGDLWVRLLAVDPGHRRRGVGRRLVSHAVEAGGRQGCAGVSAALPAPRVGALLFFQKCGFRVRGVVEDYFLAQDPMRVVEDGVPWRDALWVRRSLEETEEG